MSKRPGHPRPRKRIKPRGACIRSGLGEAIAVRRVAFREKFGRDRELYAQGRV